MHPSLGDVLPCKQNRTWQDIKAATAQVKVPSTIGQARSESAYQPTIDNETIFTNAEYAARLKAGNLSKLPYLFGNNKNGAGYYKIPAYAQDTMLLEASWSTFDEEDTPCPNSFSAFHGHANGVLTWLDRYFGDWGKLRLYPTSEAYHGSDLKMFFLGVRGCQWASRVGEGNTDAEVYDASVGCICGRS